MRRADIRERSFTSGSCGRCSGLTAAPPRGLTMMKNNMQRTAEPWKLVWILAITQVISWGTLYYAFGILAPEMQREFGWRAEIVFGAFSWSLLVVGAVATPV